MVCFELLSHCLLFSSPGRLGHTAHGGSGWCSLKVEQEKRSTAILITILGNDLWIYLTVVVVTLLYLTTHCHIKRNVCGNVCVWGGRGVVCSIMPSVIVHEEEYVQVNIQTQKQMLALCILLQVHVHDIMFTTKLSHSELLYI